VQDENTTGELLMAASADWAAFEDAAKQNGTMYWFARDFMTMLGYDEFSSFEKAVNKAIKACATLNIPLIDVVAPVERDIGGATVRDYKLSRFGCYLVAVNGSVAKPGVAAAQAYFLTLAEAFRQDVQNTGNVERLLVRGDVSEREHSLSGVASSSGVVNFAFFQNAGYRGMYNMDLRQLRVRKGVPGYRSPLDYMGREELAANLFRITQTEAKIKNENVRGQVKLEQTAHTVGATVRETMYKLSKTGPELLPAETDIKDVHKGLKRTHREFSKLDKKKTKKSLPPGD
jgi:DNA-damage-inducible protein D